MIQKQLESYYLESMYKKSFVKTPLKRDNTYSTRPTRETLNSSGHRDSLNAKYFDMVKSKMRRVTSANRYLDYEQQAGDSCEKLNWKSRGSEDLEEEVKLVPKAPQIDLFSLSRMNTKDLNEKTQRIISKKNAVKFSNHSNQNIKKVSKIEITLIDPNISDCKVPLTHLNQNLSIIEDQSKYSLFINVYL